MACFTSVAVNLENSQWNRLARKALGLPEGGLSQTDAGRVRKEAALIKTQHTMRLLSPTAVIRRQGDKLTIQVHVGG